MDAKLPVTSAANVICASGKDVETAISEKQKQLTAGSNISISNSNVISVSGTVPNASYATSAGSATNATNSTNASKVYVSSATAGYKTVADVIIEQGTSGIWTYRKWNSGVAECWARDAVAGNINISAAWGKRDAGHTVNYPSGLFIDTPITDFNWDTTGATYNVHMNIIESNSASSFTYYLRLNENWSNTAYVSYRAIGKWK